MAKIIVWNETKLRFLLPPPLLVTKALAKFLLLKSNTGGPDPRIQHKQASLMTATNGWCRRTESTVKTWRTKQESPWIGSTRWTRHSTRRRVSVRDYWPARHTALERLPRNANRYVEIVGDLFYWCMNMEHMKTLYKMWHAKMMGSAHI